MARLPDLSAIMAQQASVESAVEALCFHVSNLLDAAGTFGWLLDTSSSNPRLVASYHQDTDEVNRVADSTLPAKWLRFSEPIIIDDLSEIAPEDEMPQFAPMRVLAMPLKPGGKSIGLIAVIREAENQPFASEEVQFVSALALQVSAVVNNMELLTQTRKLVYRERILNEVSQNIRRSLDVETILDTTSRHLSSALGNRETRIQLAQQSGEAANE
jgi:GAF domain-containing protein